MPLGTAAQFVDTAHRPLARIRLATEPDRAHGERHQPCPNTPGGRLKSDRTAPGPPLLERRGFFTHG